MPKKRRGGGVSVDFTGVEAGGKAVPDGVYEVEVAEVTEEEGEKGPYLKWKFRVTDGPAKGGVIFDNTSLTPQSLWRLKGLLETLGITVPDSTMELDLGEYIGMTMPITVANEEYQGKDRPKVAQYGGDVENSTPKDTKADPKSSGGAKKKPSKEDDGDDDRPKAGAKVKFKDQGKILKGKITSIEDDTATVKTDDGDEWEISLEDLEVI